MTITEVKIRRIFEDPKSRVKAIVSIIIDGGIAIHELRVVEGTERTFVAMPNHRSVDGRFQDIAHPIDKGVRVLLEETVLAAYEKALTEKPQEVKNAS